MFFKNVMVYRFDEPFQTSEANLEELLSSKPLQPCLAQEMESFGWLTAFPEGQNYVEKAGNALFMRLGIERKILPKEAIKNEVSKKAKALGRDVKQKSQYKELEERVIEELLPNALSKQESIVAYIDLEKQWLLIDAGSIKKASLLTSYLRKTIGSLSIINHAPETSVQGMMTQWILNQESPSPSLTLLPDIEVREISDDGGVARIKQVPLESREIMQHLEGGWQVTKLRMEWQEKLAFSLGNDFIFKSLKVLDHYEEQLESHDEPLLYLQANCVLLQSEIRQMVSHIYALFNGQE